MEVIATARGFHHGLREVGDKFEVKPGLKGSWFKPTSPPKKPKGESSGKNDGESLV